MLLLYTDVALALDLKETGCLAPGCMLTTSPCSIWSEAVGLVVGRVVRAGRTTATVRGPQMAWEDMVKRHRKPIELGEES